MTEKKTNDEDLTGPIAEAIMEEAQEEKWAAITCHGQHNVAKSVHDLDNSGYDLVSVSYSGHENIRIESGENSGETPVLVPTFLAIFRKKDIISVQ